MKKQLLLLVSLLFSSFLSAQNIVGSWHGLFSFNGMDLPLIFHVEDSNNGMYKAMMDSLDQGAKNIPASHITFLDKELKIEVKNLGLSYTGILKGDSIVGIFKQGALVLPMTLTRNETIRLRPQEPKPPFSYYSEDITFYNPEVGIKLAGTLTYPSKGNNFPAVVLITGSGSQDRNEEILGHKPFWVIADYLTQRGIAVLRFDDRGFAKSEGDKIKSTTEDFATDALAAVKYLKGRKEINKGKIGLLGHSEGGIISFMLAGRHPKDIAFIISMAGSAVDGNTILKKQRRTLMVAQGATEKQIQKSQQDFDKIVAFARTMTEEDIKNDKIDSAIKVAFPELVLGGEKVLSETKGIVEKMIVSPWLFFFMDYNPTDDIRNIKCPILALNGAKDLQVSPSEHTEALKEIRKGDKALTTKVYPLHNHLFQHCQTGLPNEYGKIEETISPEVLKDIADWIKQVTK